jgi:IS5 family transposase
MIPNFADLCLLLYVTIDDHYRALPAALKPRGEQALCSDSELLTMLVVSECLGWQRETLHVSQWARHRDLFPHQPDRTRLNRRRRALTTTLTALRCRVLDALIPAYDRQCVVDALPVPVIAAHLVGSANNAGCWRSWGADLGWIASKKQHLFGYKLHLLVTLGGVIRDYVLAPASAHDVTLAPELLGGHDDLVVLGDKGYISAPLAETLREEHGLHLLTPPRKNARTPQSAGPVTLWNGLRQIVETVNAQLTAQFGIGRHGAHTFGGLAARLETKLIAHTLCVLLNWQLGKAAWLQIKALAFPI